MQVMSLRPCLYNFNFCYKFIRYFICSKKCTTSYIKFNFIELKTIKLISKFSFFPKILKSLWLLSWCKYSIDWRRKNFVFFRKHDLLILSFSTLQVIPIRLRPNLEKVCVYIDASRNLTFWFKNFKSNR